MTHQHKSKHFWHLIRLEQIFAHSLGFRELCTDKLLYSSATSFVPGRINCDIIENVFSQQRGLYNGNYTNPSFLSYCRTMNSIITGQPSVSRNSNTSGSSTEADPFNNSTCRKRRLNGEVNCIIIRFHVLICSQFLLSGEYSMLSRGSGCVAFEYEADRMKSRKSSSLELK